LIEVYTDGSCLGNPGTGGWAIVIIHNKVKETKFGFMENTTNNQMELFAAIKSLEFLKDSNDSFTIYTDSSYLKNGITTWIQNWKINNWKTSNNKKVKNIDLWMKLHDLCENKDISWKWVKAHSKNLNNNLVDDLARTAALKKIIKE